MIMSLPRERFGNAPYIRSHNRNPVRTINAVEENAVTDSADAVDPVDAAASSRSEDLIEAVPAGRIQSSLKTA